LTRRLPRLEERRFVQGIRRTADARRSGARVHGSAFRGLDDLDRPRDVRPAAPPDPDLAVLVLSPARDLPVGEEGAERSVAGRDRLRIRDATCLTGRRTIRGLRPLRIPAQPAP